MDIIWLVIDFIIHINDHLTELVTAYGPWVYGILFLIVFCETGLVVTPFLPGDSLLFAAGAIAAVSGVLNPFLLILLLLIAAVLGDSVNYSIGHLIGARIFSRPKSLLFNPAHLRRTHEFYEKYGGKTIIIARFVPIVRTFAPFVAGVGAMEYGRFFLYNVLGAVLWVPTFIFAGYYFGNVPMVKENFTLVIFAIIVISVLPAAWEVFRGWMNRTRRCAQ